MSHSFSSASPYLGQPCQDCNSLQSPLMSSCPRLMLPQKRRVPSPFASCFDPLDTTNPLPLFSPPPSCGPQCTCPEHRLPLHQKVHPPSSATNNRVVLLGAAKSRVALPAACECLGFGMPRLYRHIQPPSIVHAVLIGPPLENGIKFMGGPRRRHAQIFQLFCPFSWCFRKLSNYWCYQAPENF